MCFGGFAASDLFLSGLLTPPEGDLEPTLFDSLGVSYFLKTKSIKTGKSESFTM